MAQSPNSSLTPPPGGTPRLKPTAYPLYDLAKNAVHGHAMIAERVAEDIARVAAEHAERRAAGAAARTSAAAQLERG